MRRCNILCLFFLLFALITIDILAKDDSVEQILQEKLGSGKVSKRKKRRGVKNINFSFKDADLVDVINLVAAEKGINIILPSGANAIKSKLTITIPQKLNINEAWDILYTILDVAGYSISLKSGMYSIVKKDANLLREPLRIFIATPYEQIPNTDERIIYLAYFANIQVPSGEGGAGKNVVQELLTTYVSQEAGKSFKFVPESNGVMIIDKASNIRSIMKILKELDKAGVKEHLEMVQLQHTSSKAVAELFNKQGGLLEKPSARRYRLGVRRKSEVSYFEKGAKIVPEERTNSVIILGSREAVEKIKDFIYRFIDVTIGAGRSVLHRYKLDYLEANKLREVLLRVIGAEGAEGAQARAGAGLGPERFFSNPQIETDYPQEQEGEEEQGKYKYYGTNSLLVAANSEDWGKIKHLIQSLDKPQPQIIIEVLIVDLRLQENKNLGAQTRNPALAPLMKLSREGRAVEAQSAQLASVIGEYCTECGKDSAKIKSDLLQKEVPTFDDGGTTSNPLLEPTAGTTMFSLSDKDGKTWSVLKLLSLYDNAKVLSHPYIVAKNNKQAKIVVGLEKILQGNAEGGVAGVTTVRRVPVKADTVVDIKPRIGGSDIVNVEIGIKIDEYAEDTSVNTAGLEPRVQREIYTNANIKSGEILALGGLIRVDNSNTEGRSPILGRIPILGWLFKSRSASRSKNNLTVFIRPTIIEPEFRGGITSYTKDYIAAVKEYSKEGGLFEGLRDPITRWFFRDEKETTEMIDDFVEQHKQVIPLEEIMVAKNKSALVPPVLLAEQKNAKAATSDVKSQISSDTPVLSVATESSTPEEKILIVDNETLYGESYENADGVCEENSDKSSENVIAANMPSVVSDDSDKLKELLKDVDITVAQASGSVNSDNQVQVKDGDSQNNSRDNSEDELKELLKTQQNPLISYFDSIG